MFCRRWSVGTDHSHSTQCVQELSLSVEFLVMYWKDSSVALTYAPCVNEEDRKKRELFYCFLLRI